MTIKTFECEAWVSIDIDESQCSNVISRCTENEDGWRDLLYDLKTSEEVYEHLAFNCLVNGITDIRRLDGWADVPKDAVRMRVDRPTFSARVAD